MRSSAHERALAGAAFLADRQPAGWESRVDPLTLNVGNPLKCVLGQLYGTYGTGVLRLKLTLSAEVYRLGFMADGASAVRELTLAWLDVLAARLHAGVVTPLATELLAEPKEVPGKP